MFQLPEDYAKWDRDKRRDWDRRNVVCDSCGKKLLQDPLVEDAHFVRQAYKRMNFTTGYWEYKPGDLFVYCDDCKDNGPPTIDVSTMHETRAGDDGWPKGRML